MGRRECHWNNMESLKMSLERQGMTFEGVRYRQDEWNDLRKSL